MKKLKIKMSIRKWSDMTKFEICWIGFWLGAMFGGSIAFLLTVFQ